MDRPDCGENYHVWQEWDLRPFGAVRSHESAYFARELKGVRARKVLEIGFGNGLFLSFAKSIGLDAHGVEIDHSLIDAARRAGFSVSHYDNIGTLGGFDLIVAFDVLEHMPVTAIGELVQQVARSLAPGGHFIARFPNGQSPFGLLNQHGDSTHVTSIAGPMIRQFAIATGLEVIAIRNPRLWLHTNFAIACARIAQRVIAKMIEVAIGIAFYSRIEPMQPNLVAHLRKPI